MALIKCPECSREVSSAAAACPQCGHPINAAPVAVPWAPPSHPCAECSRPVVNGNTNCPHCGCPQDGYAVVSGDRSPQQAGGGLIAAGYVCAGLAALIVPAGFGLAAVVIGVVNLIRGQVGHGIAQMVLGVACALFGTMVSLSMLSL